MARRLKDQHIIIVEDDPLVSDALVEYFKPQNKVEAFITAEAALEAKAGFSTVNVFIIDYHLPGMNGVDLFLLLQNDFKAARYILITGDMSYELADSTRQLGLDALILKPFDFSILEDNISTLTSAAA